MSLVHRRKAVIATGSILLAILASWGCIYLPPIGPQFTEEKQTRIIAGATGKDEVVKLLGKPDLLEDKRFFLYRRSRESGTIIFFGVHPGGGIFPVPINWDRFVILLEFDDRDVVKRYEIEAAKESLYGTTPEGMTSLRSLVERELVFKGETRDFLGFATGIGFNSVHFSPDGKFLGAGGFKLVGGTFSSKQIWIKNLETGQLRSIETGNYQKAIISPDFTRAALLERSVTVLDLNTGKTLAVFTRHGDSSFWTVEGASCLAFDAQSSLVATGGYKGLIKIWDSRTGEELRSFQGHDGAVFSIAYSLDGRRLATSGRDETVSLWDAGTGHMLATLKGKTGTVRLSPDGNILAINRGRYVELWQANAITEESPEAPTMRLVDVVLLPFFQPNWPVEQSLDFSPNGRFLAAGQGGMVVYDIPNVRTDSRVIPSGEILHNVSVNDAVLSLAFSSDGTRLAIGTTGGVYLWRLRF